MFKVNIPITKSYSKGNILIIEGFASDSTIDRDYEKFSDEAVLGMEKSVNNGDIPIKVEHEDKIYSEIGVWKEAKMIDNKLFVKGEIDLDLSMGKDIEVLLKKGFDIALSVGGSVVEAVMDYSEEAGRMIKTYINIILDEISVVKNPANYNATLSIAKSYNFEKKKETMEGLKLTKSAKQNTLAVKTFNKAFNDIEKAIGQMDYKDYIIKSCDKADPYEGYKISNLTSLDYRTIGMIYRIFATIGADEVIKPAGLDWENTDKLPDYSFVPSKEWQREFAYMDKNMNLKEDWITYHMFELAKGNMSWLSAEERSYIMQFLYATYMQIQKNKAEKSISNIENNILKDNKKTMTKKVDVKKTEEVEVVETETTEVETEVVKEEVVKEETKVEEPEVKKEETKEEDKIEVTEVIKTSELIKSLEKTLNAKILEVEKSLNSVKELEETLTAKITKVEETLTKSIKEVKEANAETLTKSTEVTKKADEDLKENLDAIVKSIGTLYETVDNFGKSSNYRKSTAVAIEKGNEVEKSTQELIVEKMKTNGGSFADARASILAGK